jgi:hypothetical protein
VSGLLLKIRERVAPFSRIDDPTPKSKKIPLGFETPNTKDI